jgi:hypothetical protein
MIENMMGVAAPHGSTYDPFHGNKQGSQAPERKPITEGISQANAQSVSGITAPSVESRKEDQPQPKQESTESDDSVLDSIVGSTPRSENAAPRNIPEVEPAVIAAQGSPASQAPAQSAVTASEDQGVTEQRHSDRKRQIKKDVFVDVFDVIRAFGLTCPAQMAVLSDLLMAGPKDLEDRYLMLLDSRDNLDRAIELMEDEMGIQSSLK